jgi:hypothetical protein
LDQNSHHVLFLGVLWCLVFCCFPLSTVNYASKDANMAAEFEENCGLLLVTSLGCEKGSHQNVGEGYIT